MPWTFLAIKLCERTKIGKVIKQSRSSKLRWAHICAHSRIPVNNQSGDLDLYVVHHEHEKFQSKNDQIIWESISKRMRAALPQVSERMMKELQKAGVYERVYSAGAANFLSKDLLVNNVGVSESYQSPPHIDKNDIGWTCAFACKCGPCSSCC
jgi:hypothetical protein